MTTSVNIVSSVIDTWRRFGVFDFILPFLLVFGIVYGILERTNLFGDKGKSVNSIIAFAIAMTTTLTGWFISFLTGFLPWVSVISIVIITALMLIALFSEGFYENFLKKDKVLKYGSIAVVVSLGAVLIWLGAPIFEALNISNLLNSMGLTVNDLWGIVFFAGFIITLAIIGHGGTSSGGSSPSP